MTSDAVGGVWTYTEELVSGLIRRGHRVTLVSLGPEPKSDQTTWMTGLSELDYRLTTYKLEWMQGAARDIENSTAFLGDLVEEVSPDLLHLNQYCYGSLRGGVPRIIVAHSDVMSWWHSVHGCEPQESPWMAWYRNVVKDGLRAADTVIAPSKWMRDKLLENYATDVPTQVIYNGRSPELFAPKVDKEDFVLSVGRLWDQGKQVDLLAKQEQALNVCIVGNETEPGAETSCTTVRFCGEQSQEELRRLFSRAAIYAATSRYEPFGLAPLEAAFSRCALVANDIPTFHELWENAAYYFPANDAMGLRSAIRKLADDPGLRKHYSDRAYRRACDNFTAEKMIDSYEHLFKLIASPVKAI
jgi:glycosyltransferase involved in cell wall biosynthesis